MLGVLPVAVARDGPGGVEDEDHAQGRDQPRRARPAPGERDQEPCGGEAEAHRRGEQQPLAHDGAERHHQVRDQDERGRVEKDRVGDHLLAREPARGDSQQSRVCRHRDQEPPVTRAHQRHLVVGVVVAQRVRQDQQPEVAAQHRDARGEPHPGRARGRERVVDGAGGGVLGQGVAGHGVAQQQAAAGHDREGRRNRGDAPQVRGAEEPERERHQAEYREPGLLRQHAEGVGEEARR